MIVAIQAKGHSFKGLHAYLSHDKRTAEEEAKGVKNNSKERVDFTATHNLSTDNLEFAWRVMAATAINQNELKREARARGEDVRISSKVQPPVMHIVASWDQSFVDQHGIPTSDHYREALNDVLKELGAESHQAIAYAHKDTDNYHLHIMLNRVSPRNGQLLKDSNEQKKAQKFAQDYCKKYNLDICPNRELNAKIRAEYARAKGKAAKIKDPIDREIAMAASGEILDRLEGNKRLSQPEYDARKLARDIANDRPETAKQLERNYAKRVKELSQRGTSMRARQAQDIRALSTQHKTRKNALYKEHNGMMKMVAKSIRSEYTDEIVGVMKRLKAEEKKFIHREKSTTGRLFNTLKTMVMDIGDKAISEPFSLIASSGDRLAVLQADHKKQMATARKEQNDMVESALKELRAIRKQALYENLMRYRQEHARMRHIHGEEKTVLTQDWKTLNVERKRKFEAQKPSREFSRSTKRLPTRDRSRTRTRR